MYEKELGAGTNAQFKATWKSEAESKPAWTVLCEPILKQNNFQRTGDVAHG